MSNERKAHSPRLIRVEHGIAHLENRRTLTRPRGRHEHMNDIIQAVTTLLSHQQMPTHTTDERM